MQEPEVERVLLDGAHHLHGHVYEPEGDGAAEPPAQRQRAEPDEHKCERTASDLGVLVARVADDGREDEEQGGDDHDQHVERRRAPERRAPCDREPFDEPAHGRKPAEAEPYEQGDPPALRERLLRHSRRAQRGEHGCRGIGADRGIGHRRVERMAGKAPDQVRRPHAPVIPQEGRAANPTRPEKRSRGRSRRRPRGRRGSRPRHAAVVEHEESRALGLARFAPCRGGYKNPVRSLPRVALALLVLGLVSCGSPEPLSANLPRAEGSLELASPAFENRGELPKEFGCDGKGETPPLEWSGVPQGTAELALVMVDLDAPSGVLAHWVVYGIGPQRTHLDAGVGLSEAREGETSFGRQAYEPPCPPEGDDPHRYVIALYALGSDLDLPEGSSAGTVFAKIGRLALASGRIEARFAR